MSNFVYRASSYTTSIHLPHIPFWKLNYFMLAVYGAGPPVSSKPRWSSSLGFIMASLPTLITKVLRQLNFLKYVGTSVVYHRLHTMLHFRTSQPGKKSKTLCIAFPLVTEGMFCTRGPGSELGLALVSPAAPELSIFLIYWGVGKNYFLNY